MSVQVLEEIYTCDAEEVIVPPERVRKEFDKKRLMDLAESFKTRRQDQPGICFFDEEKRPVLVAGECRLRACLLAKVPYTFRLESECDPVKLLEIELEENLYRTQLTWMEEAQGLARLHELKQSLYGESKQGGRSGWGLRQTAGATNRSLGHVSETIELAKFAAAMPEQFKDVKSKSDAKKIVQRMVQDAERTKAFDEAKEKAEEKGVDALNVVEKQIQFYSEMIVCGKMETVLPALDKQFDVVFFDPPWGVDFDEVSETVHSQQKYEDKLEEFLKTFQDRLAMLYELMSENSHLYTFYGIVNNEFVFNSLEKAGFTVNRMPLIWWKQGSRRTRNPEIWPGRSYEPIAYARKGNKKLIKLGAPDVIPTPAPTATMKQIHPSAKHPMIYLELLHRSAFPGDKILDPMAGSGMMGVAAEVMRPTHHLDWLEVEELQTYCNLALDNVVKGFHRIAHQEDRLEGDEEL